MKIKLLTEIDQSLKDKWEMFISNHQNGNFFQSIGYYNFYRALSDYEPMVIIGVNNNDDLIGIMLATIQKEKGIIKEKLSSRCIIYGGPIAKNNDEKVTDFLLKELIKICEKKAIFIEFRNLFDLSKSIRIFKDNGFEYKGHYNFKLEIKSIDYNLKKLNKTRRWEINKSLKEGAKIIEIKSIKELNDFYLILKNLYKEKVKKPLPSFNFFKQFFLNPTLGKFFLVEYSGAIIGGTMCPIFKETIYELYECSIDKKYKNIYPGSLATWAPIEFAAKNGLKYFDFLGAGSSDKEYGVREFKSKFGGKLFNYGRFLRINNKILYNIGKAGLKIDSIFR